MSLEVYDISPSLIRRKADESSTTNTPISRPLCANKQNVASRYLSASTGSCHDVCKYGKFHEFEDTKPWKPRRRVSAPSLNNKNNADIQIFVDKKVKNGVKTDEVKPSSANEKIKKVSPSCKRTPLVDSSKYIKQEGNSSSKWSAHAAPKMVTTPSQPERKKNTREGRLSSDEASKMVRKVVQSAQTLKTPTQFDQNKNVNTMKSSSSPNPTKSKEKRMSEPKTANARVSRVAAKEIPTPLTVTSPLRRKSRVKTDPSPNLRSTGSNMKKTKSLENNRQISRALIEEGEDSIAATLNGTECIQSICPLTDESPNSSSQTYPISFTSHEIDSECDDSVSSSDDSGKMQGPTHGGVTLDFEDGENPKSVNLKFTRGRVIEPESESKRGMKVKFKQGRILEPKQEVNDGLRRKNYRKRATENLKRESRAPIAEVILKHQDVEMKKEELVLLNNVIEQTANKLVETKKSKVKALVGAFETVISLQDRKSSGADR